MAAIANLFFDELPEPFLIFLHMRLESSSRHERVMIYPKQRMLRIASKILLPEKTLNLPTNSDHPTTGFHDQFDLFQSFFAAAGGIAPLATSVNQ